MDLLFPFVLSLRGLHGNEFSRGGGGQWAGRETEDGEGTEDQLHMRGKSVMGVSAGFRESCVAFPRISFMPFSSS